MSVSRLGLPSNPGGLLLTDYNNSRNLTNNELPFSIIEEQKNDLSGTRSLARNLIRDYHTLREEMNEFDQAVTERQVLPKARLQNFLAFSEQYLE